MNQYFVSLVLGLTQQADAALDGSLPPGAGDQGAGDPTAVAKALIDTLGMLEEKTAGHLDDDERKLLTEALTALRFRYVKASTP